MPPTFGRLVAVAVQSFPVVAVLLFGAVRATHPHTRHKRNIIAALAALGRRGSCSCKLHQW